MVIATPFVADNADHAFHQYLILLDLNQFKCSRDGFVAALKRHRVEAIVPYPRAIMSG